MYLLGTNVCICEGKDLCPTLSEKDVSFFISHSPVFRHRCFPVHIVDQSTLRVEPSSVLPGSQCLLSLFLKRNPVLQKAMEKKGTGIG